YLAKEHLELVDRAAESKDERLRAIARRACCLERALLLETRELGGRPPQPRERQRRRQASTKHRDALLEAFEAPAKLVLEVLGRQIVEPLHVGLEVVQIALDQLRGLLERVALG